MAEVLLLHSALGLRRGVLVAADRLRATGHRVTVPDLYDGQVFDRPDAGIAHMQWIGWDRLVARAESAAAGLYGPFAVLGMSMGAGLAVHLVGARPRVTAAVLLYGGESSDKPWPSGVPVQVHHTVHDPWADVTASTHLVTSAARNGARAELHLYPGGKHLLDDSDLPEHHDPDAAALMWPRVEAFLATL